MNAILIPTDFSPCAYNAAKYILQLAGKLKAARIILFNALGTEENREIILNDILPPTEEALKEAQLAAKSRLNDWRKQLLQELPESGFELECLTDSRTLSDSLPDLIAQENVELIVSGISYFGDQGKSDLGKDIARIATELEAPVLVIPTSASYKPIQSVVLSCDLRDVMSTLPAELIKQLIRELGAHLVVANVDFENRHFAPGTIWEQQSLHHLLDELQPEIEYVEDKDVVHGVLQLANKKNAGLIISIPKEHGIFYRLFHPSVTKRLAGLTQLPLLILHK